MGGWCDSRRYRAPECGEFDPVGQSILAEVHIKDRSVPTERPSLRSHRARMGKKPTTM